MRSASILWLVAGALVALVACDAEDAPSGVLEPLRVPGGFFKSGALPAGHHSESAPDAALTAETLAVTTVEASNAPAHPGQAGRVLNGRTTDDAYAIGVRFKELGSGYWVVPVGVPDLSFPGELTWHLPIDLGPDLPPGNHTLQLVAIDEHGNGGADYELTLCVLPPFDPSRNACDPEAEPPAAILSLSWDEDSDVDLVVQTPSGKLVSAKHLSTSDDPAHASATQAGVGYFDGDSNAQCRIDSIRREDVIWNVSPEHGAYQVYANLFSACGKPATHFCVTAYARARGDKPGTYRFIQLTQPVSGVLLAGSANGGKSNGLYVTTITFP